MFFSRLRRHAKWMFVFLALVFAVGFVGFGIGANQNASIGDLLRGGGGDGRQRLGLGRARSRAEEPEERRSAAQSRDRAPGGRPDRGGDRRAEPLPRTSAPKDKEALQELAGLHLSRANVLARDAQAGTGARQLSHVRLDVQRPARPRQGRDARPRPDRRGDLDAGEPGRQ